MTDEEYLERVAIEMTSWKIRYGRHYPEFEMEEDMRKVKEELIPFFKEQGIIKEITYDWAGPY